jgi:hypothetical protein
VGCNHSAQLDVNLLPSFTHCSALSRAAHWRQAMFRTNAITLAINSILIGPVGIHLSYSGYIIASS